MTPSMLVWLKLFPSLRRAQARLKRMTELHLAESLGWVCLPGKSREKLYACFTVKGDNEQHEVEISAVVLRMACDSVTRGRYVDPTYWADAELTINGQPYKLELDRDTMKESQIKERYATYKDVDCPVLWVCPDRPRMEELMRLAKNDRFMFTTFDLAVADPHAGIWLDLEGNYNPLQRTLTPAATPPTSAETTTRGEGD